MTREAAQQAHDAALAIALVRHGLQDPVGQAIVTRVYTAEYARLKDLRLEDALDQICRIAAALHAGHGATRH